MTDRTVSVRLQMLIDTYQRNAARATAVTRGLAHDVGVLGSTNKATAATLKPLGGGALIAGAALGGLGLMATRTAMTFDRAMSNVQASTRAAGSEINALRAAALKAGADTQFTATEAAQAVDNLAKAGVSTADILGGGLTGALDLAAAGQLDVAQAAEIAATSLVQFKLRGSDMAHVADVLAAGAGKAQGSVYDMALAMQYAGVPAASLGASLDETAGTLALFANNGIIGERAGTSFRSMIASLSAPSIQAQAEMERLGISVFDAQGNFVGLEDLAGELQDALGGATQATRSHALGVIFGNEALQAANVLVNEGADGVAKWTDAVDDQGYAAETAAIKMDNLSGDIEKLGGSIDTALIQGGTKATGVLRFLTQTATEMVNQFSALPAPLQTTFVVLGGLTGVVLVLGGGFIFLRERIIAAQLALTTFIATASTASKALMFVGAASGILIAIAAVWGLVTAVRTLTGTLQKDLDAALQGAAKLTGNELVAAFDQAHGSMSFFQRLAETNIGTAERLRDALAAEGRDVVELDLALAHARGEQERMADATGATAGALTEQEQATQDATDALDAYSDMLDGILSAAFGVEDATDKVTRGLGDLQRQVLDARDAGDVYASSLDESTQAGLDNREAMRGLVTDIAAVAEEMRIQGATTGEVAAMMAAQRDRLIEVASQMGISREAAARYVDVLLQIEGVGDIYTSVTIDTSQAIAALRQLADIASQIPLVGGYLSKVIGDAADQAPVQSPALPRPRLGGASPSRPTGGGGGGRSPADDAAAWRRAEGAHWREMYEHARIGIDEYMAQLDRLQAAERQFSSEWFAIEDERQRVRDEVADNVAAWNEAIARNQQEAVDEYMRVIRVQYDLGERSESDYLRHLQTRLGQLDRYSAEAGRIRDEIAQIEDAAERARERASDERSRKREQALDRLSRLLEQEAGIRSRMSEQTRQHNDRLRDIDARYNDDLEGILDDRRDVLYGWMDATERFTAGWANSVGSITGNLQQQAAAFTEWQDLLAAAKARGVSQAVIDLLGLDDGPQALAQLRMFSSATQLEIDDLNAAVVSRTALAADQVAREQVDATSNVGQMLVDLAEQHAAQIETETEEFLATMREMRDELAALGEDQGKSYGDALRDGLRSTIDGVREAARDLQRAMKDPDGSSTDGSGSRRPGYTLPIIGSRNPGYTLPALRMLTSPTVRTGDTKVSVFVDGKKAITDTVKVILSDHTGQRTVVGSA